MRSAGSPIERRTPDAGGFTLIEVCWTMASFQSLLREWKQRMATEGRPACLTLDGGAKAYSVYRGACHVPTRVAPQTPHPAPERVRRAAPGSHRPLAPTPRVTFRPRGPALQASVQVARSVPAKVYTARVEGLTGRVSRA